MENLKVGLQLYSIRDAMKADMDAALGQVKAMGYDYVEFAGGRYGRTAAETRQLLDKHSLQCISVHQSPSFFLNDPADAVSYVQQLGAGFCVIPIHRLPNYTDDWEGTVALFTRMGKAFKAAGIQLLYHNHDFELTKLENDDTFILDKLLSTVPAELLQPEFDSCWLSYGGASPVSYIEKYAQRLDVVHLKDYLCADLEPKPIWKLLEDNVISEKPAKKSEAGFRYMPVGSGVEDWPAIIGAIRRSTAQYVVVEQDDSRDMPPLEAAAQSCRYLRENLGI